MVAIEIDGRTLELPEEIPGAASTGGFVFGIHKGGSSMLIMALRRMARRAAIKYANLALMMHVAGIPPDTATLSPNDKAAVFRWLDNREVLFAGWRQFPAAYDIPLTSESRTYLLIRDPRDIATSKYFSLKYSHTTAGAGGEGVLQMRQRLQTLDIDTYALEQAHILVRRFREYAPLHRTRLMLRRYEDVIFDKHAFLSDLARHFEIDVPPFVLSRLAETIDERPEKEDIHAHVRQVAPGDHRRKLKSGTIGQMNDILAEVLSAYDYSEKESLARV
jgi:hypothetical protein